MPKKRWLPCGWRFFAFIVHCGSGDLYRADRLLYQMAVRRSEVV